MPKPVSLLHWMSTTPRRRRRRSSQRSRAPEFLGDVLSAIEPLVRPDSEQRIPIARDTWQQVVGKRIAGRSSPERLHPDGTLMVRVPNSVWAQELSLLSSSILERLGLLGIVARQMRFVVGPLAQDERPTSLVVRRRVAKPVALPLELHAQLAQIADPDLRRAIEQAAKRSLAMPPQETPEPPGPKSKPGSKR